MLYQNPLLWGSAVMFVSSMFSNLTAYLFNLFVGRSLGPTNYGILAAVISLLSIISILTATASLVIVRFTSGYKAQGDWASLAVIFKKLNLVFFGLGLALFLVFYFFRFSLADFLKIPDPLPIVILGGLFFFSVAQTVNNGIITGLQNFNFIAITGAFSATLKLLLGFVFVLMGFSVNGALGAITLAIGATYLLSFVPLRRLFTGQPSHGPAIPWRSFFVYSGPVLIATLGLNLLINSDIIMVKRYFLPSEAGIYSALSLVGRVIFFATSSIVAVMFSLVAERHSGERKYKHLLYYSLLLTLAVSLPVIVFYYLFPAFSMKFFFGDKYLSASPYLWLFGVFITLYSLVNILVNFLLSIKKVSVAWLPLLASLLQIVLLYFWHDHYIEVISVSLATIFLLLISLMLYYLQHETLRDRPRLPSVEDNR